MEGERPKEKRKKTQENGGSETKHPHDEEADDGSGGDEWRIRVTELRGINRGGAGAEELERPSISRSMG